MRTSRSEGRPPVREQLLSMLLTLITVIVVDVVAGYLFIPYATQTELMWDEYRATQDIDTVLVGSSVAGYGLSPMALDEVLSSHSFNMGTPGQSLNDSLRSIKTAVAEHNVRRAVLCVGYETLIEQPSISSSVSYTLGKCQGEGPLEAVTDYVDLMTYEYFFSNMHSLSAPFPWANLHVDYTSTSIAANLERRATMDVLEAARTYAEVSGDVGWDYYGRGHGAYELLDPSSVAHGTRHTSHHDTVVVEDCVRAVIRLCDWCAENDVELFVVGAPYMPCAVLEYGEKEWLPAMARIQQIAEARGAHYLDLSFARRAYFSPDPTLFMNGVHLNHQGAELAGAFVGTIIRDIEAGMDVSGRFFTLDEAGWEEYLDSIPFVDALDYTARTERDEVRITACPVTSAPCLYRFEMRAQGDEDWELVRDWSAERTLVIPFRGHEKDMELRVAARSDNEYAHIERFVEGVIRFEEGGNA